MKIKRVVQMVSATTDTGRLACDMYDLDAKEYYSEAQAEHIPIADMDFQHLVRAFIKQLAKEKTNHCNTVDIVKAKDSIIKKLREDLQGGFKQSVDDLDSLEAQEKIIAGLRSQVETLSAKVKDQDRGRVLRIRELNTRCDTQAKTIADYIDKVEQLEDMIEEKDQEQMNYTAMLERQRDMYKSIAQESTRLNGHYYTFCEVPQDEEGKEFIKNCKKYLNRESYTIRVRGQHLKKELHGQGRAYHGANMEDSSHMRVYIDKKKGDK